MRSAARAWLVLAAGVATYDLVCPKGETLSEDADRGLVRHPYLTRLAVFLVAIHVANVAPAKYDPIHVLFATLPRKGWPPWTRSNSC